MGKESKNVTSKENFVNKRGELRNQNFFVYQNGGGYLSIISCIINSHKLVEGIAIEPPKLSPLPEAQ